MKLHKPNCVRLLILIAAIVLALPIFPARAATQSYTVLHRFGDGSVANDGISPQAGLIQGSDGYFYGTTSNGGSANNGTVFKMTPTGAVTILHSFSDGSVANDGISPQAALIQGSDGNFYGTTVIGGSADNGTVFKMTPAGAVTILHSFGDGSVPNDGANPDAALIQGADGNFYGTTEIGGAADSGAVFTMTSAGAVTILHSFDDGSVPNDGVNPSAALIQGSDGNFYSATYSGGSTFKGTVFKMTPAGAVTILHSFGDGSVPNDGEHPDWGIILGLDGNFYGTTYAGGSAENGTAFKMTPAGVVTILHSFNDGSTVNDGVSPAGGVIEGLDGNFYGTTQNGGSANLGVVFEMTPAGVVTILHSFSDGSTFNDGLQPTAGLVQGSDGNLYGTTSSDGFNGTGTVFVESSPATHFSVSAPANTTAGTPFTVTVTALNKYNGMDFGYTGIVHFTCDDPSSILPADTIVVNGTGTVQVTAFNATTVTVRARDTTTSTITGTGSTSVAAAAVTQLSVAAPANTNTNTSTSTGVANAVVVAAQDQYGNVVKSFSDTIHFTSTDPNAVLPADAVLTNGAKLFSVKYTMPGTQSITVTDTTNLGLTATTKRIVSLIATKFKIVTPATVTAGVPFVVSVTAVDNYGNTVPGYTGTVHFTSADPAATLPANATLTNGAGTFSATLTKVGAIVIKATDTVKSTITGPSGLITVSAGVAASLTVTGPSSVTAGAGIQVTVTAKDVYGNVATGDTDTIHLTSTDPIAVLYSDAALVKGTKTFTIKLKTVGSQTVTATDIGTSLAGTSNSISVH